MNKNSPLYNQSKDMIAGALIELMREKDIAKISVSELADKAMVARRTFYKHFETKDDVIMHLMKDISDKYTKVLDHAYITSPYEYGIFFFSFFKQYKTELKVLKNHNLLFSISYQMHKNFMTENTDVVERMKIHNTVYNLAYRFGGIFFMLSEWIENDCKEDIKEMARLLELEIKPPSS